METATQSAADKPVIWVFRDNRNAWRVRREGEGREPIFRSRRDALAFGRLLGLAAGGYKMFFELRDGRFSCEFLNYC